MTAKKSLGGDLLNRSRLENSTQESSQLKVFSSSQPSSFQSKAEASSSQDNNKSDKEDEKDEDKKIIFYLKLGKFKKFKCM